MTYRPAPTGLPDPVIQAAFYSGTTAKRAFAWFIDFGVVLVISVLLSILTFGVGFFLFGAILFIVSLVYRIATIASKSATWGMRFLGVELRGPTGARFTGSEAALHTVLYMIFATLFLPQIVSWAMMIFTDRGQGLHDMIMGSAAINSPR